jgi:hypothetical protein
MTIILIATGEFLDSFICAKVNCMCRSWRTDQLAVLPVHTLKEDPTCTNNDA